ncbi:MAG: dTDP-4-dehydrorhamnose 3,5-epimerase [Myxococcota bacterium]|jgi:dTDP-4-dehydrorhamnose 3,5-epimerase
MRGLRRIEPRQHRDNRGRFLVAWRTQDLVLLEGWAPFVQESISESRRGVLRGLHMQHPIQQGKLVRVIHGAIFDVVVDLRPDSTTRGEHRFARINSDSASALWIPPGLAHGFLVESEEAIVLYQVTAPWTPNEELTIRWDDPALGIDWPLTAPPILSKRDAAAPPLSAALSQPGLH